MNNISPSNSSRRSSLKKIAGTAALTVLGSVLSERILAAEKAMPPSLRGKINHSVCRWCYNDIPLEELCKAAKEMGISSVELVGPTNGPC